MRKGFTMIELIFVIVILGVLASVAIPRLAATRDDAEIAKASTNLAMAVENIAAYYTARGDFNNTVSGMTSAFDTAGTDGTGIIAIKKKDCIKIEAKEGTDTIKVIHTGVATDTVCKSLAESAAAQSICKGTTDTAKKAVKDLAKAGATGCTIKVGGSNVVFN